MRQSDDELAKRVAGLLDRGANELEPRLAERLAAARKQALARYEARPASAWGWAAVTNAGPQYGGERRYGMRAVLLAAAVASAIALGVSWHTNTGSDIADIDAGLLTDELPINAFLDQGFDSWLKRGSR